MGAMAGGGGSPACGGRPSRPRHKTAPALSKGRASSYVAAMKTTPRDTLRRRLLDILARGRIWVRRHIRPGFRLPIGLLLIGGGFLGFLPVLGFWMIPLGLAIIFFDVPWVRRKWVGLRGWWKAKRRQRRQRRS